MKTVTKEQPKEAQQVELDPAVLGTTQVATVVKAPVGPVREETGFEDFTQEDLKVPFMVILQPLSPEVQEENPKYVPGAKAGMFMNRVTRELFPGKTGITGIPVHRTHQYLEWIPRDDGGGLAGVYEKHDPIVEEARKKAGRKFGKLKVNDNNDLAQTFNVFFIQLLPSGKREFVTLGFSSSQIGPYQEWMTNAIKQTKTLPDGTEAPRPLWSHRYRLTSAFNTNKKGSWFKIHAEFDGADAEAARYEDSDPLMKEAKDFRALILSGAAKADFDSAAQDVEGEESGYAM